jgi:alpha-L-fucosidase
MYTRLLTGVIIMMAFYGTGCICAKKSSTKESAYAAKFEASVDSLKQYQCPEWFRDAKFGIWAHWGPQAVPGQGDWYARKMYEEKNDSYKYHVAYYGHPSKFGYKDIIPLWKAEKWDPDYLMSLYKKAGAKYFVSMGVHHDNFDLWNSTYHKWNAVQMGPRRDIVGQWQKAAKKNGLYFGVSEHLGASNTWFQTSHGADSQGPMAKVPYDGADPKYQDLYHPENDENKDGKLKWYSDDPKWHQEWKNRIQDLVDQYKPDLLYTDGGMPFEDVGRGLVSHFYNANAKQHNGKLEAVYTCKDPGMAQTCVLDIERGGMKDLNALPWQTDTSNGDWYYRVNDKYKTPSQVICLLLDIVSKNGNMLLNVVLKPDGSLPPESEHLLKELSDWMAINGEAIFATRPWEVYGEGPTVVAGGGFKEDFPFNADDIRFTRSKDGKTVYVICLGEPTKDFTVKSMQVQKFAAAKITLLGNKGNVSYTVNPDNTLTIQPPKSKGPKHLCKYAYVFKLKGFEVTAANP